MISKSQVKFVPKDRSAFFPTLKDRVDTYFTENNLSKYGDNSMIIKSIILTSGYLLPFVGIMVFHTPLWLSLIAWAVMGLAVSGIGMGVMHDANHGAYSSNKKINNFFGNFITLLGASGYNWRNQHNVLHHTYTNITHIDEDIDDKLILKFSPHTPTRGVHKFQWLYAFPLYAITTLYWVTVKDFMQFRRHIAKGVNKQSAKDNNILLAKMILLKIIYFGTFFALPTLVFGVPFWEIFAGFCLMHFIAGTVLTIIFQLAHTVEETSHPMPNEKGIIENNWAIHQMNTTVNFCPNNKILSWYIGGLNYQVEHHLFPLISHIHYPQIAPIVKATAIEFNVPYLENDTFVKAFMSHIGRMQTLGELDLNEAIA